VVVSPSVACNLNLFSCGCCAEVGSNVQVRTNPNKEYGYNAATGEYEDLMKAGIIDPAKVREQQLDIGLLLKELISHLYLAKHSNTCVVVHLSGFQGLAMLFLPR
jgi:hypothetical protein